MTRLVAAASPRVTAAVPGAAATGVFPAPGAGGRIAFHTFGCKLNQFETEALASSLRTRGFTVVAERQDAEVYIVNTCTVTTRADHKARALIRGLARGHPEALVVVTGCSAQLEAGRLAGLAGNVVVVPQARKGILLDLASIIAQARSGEIEKVLRGSGQPVDPFTLTAGVHSFHTRAYMKVQDGCNGRCSYCRVPLARGPSVSLDPAEALRRVAELEARGYREIVITGVNISSYGAGDHTLASLLEKLLQATRCARFRLSSLEPESVTGHLAEVLAHPRICPHFHIPVQSGSDRILARMNRPYTAEHVATAVGRVRAAHADPFLAADIIVGFPGETTEDFEASRSLVQSLGLSALHVFPFSPRPGTAALTLRPSVPEHVRSLRTRELMAHSRRSTAAYSRSWVGREVEVLVEEQESGRFFGVTGNYLKVEVENCPAADDVTGRLVRAHFAAEGSARFLSVVE
jgi:threonylcarbamoyladenosine tRNA methylthiotransferase MtaB